MTNRLKTVRYKKLIRIKRKDGKRIAGLLSQILDNCGFNTCIDDFSENTDYVITSETADSDVPEDVIHDTIVYDDPAEGPSAEGFRAAVTDYVNAVSEDEDGPNYVTYSDTNYAADVACRNVSVQGSETGFDIVCGGILGRARIDNGRYSVEEVLVCAAALTASGVPMASVLEFFNS